MPTVRLIARVQAKPGKEQPLRTLLRSLIQPTLAEPQSDTYELYESDHPGRFYFYEIWPDQAALDKHMASAHFQRASSQWGELIDGEPELNILTRQHG
jgi:quinol monooxygenase YgiN